MSETHKGFTGLTEQPAEVEKMPGQGWATYRNWHGSKAAVAGAVAALEAEGYTQISYGSLDGPMWYLRAGIPARTDEDEQPVDTWELLGDFLTQDIRLTPAFQALGDSVLEDIDKKLGDPGCQRDDSCR